MNRREFAKLGLITRWEFRRLALPLPKDSSAFFAVLGSLAIGTAILLLLLLKPLKRAMPGV